MTTDDEIRQLSEKIEETKNKLYLQTGDSKDRNLARGKLIEQYCHLAILHQRDGKLDEAIDDYHNAITRGSSEDEFIRSRVVECYVRSGFLRCQKDERIELFEARLDFERAFDLDSKANYLFSTLQRENPQNIIANILKALYGEQFETFSDELLDEIRADPQTAYKILHDWEVGRIDSKVIDICYSLLAVVCYESKGEFGCPVMGTLWEYEDKKSVVHAFGFPRDWLSLEYKPHDEWETRRYLLSKLHRKGHPVGWFGLGYCYAQSGEILSAIEMFEELSKKLTGNKNLFSTSVAEVIELAPRAIERHVQKKEFHMAALLSKRIGDYSRAAELYELLAAGLEKGEDGIIESTKVIISKGLNNETTVFNPSPESAVTDYLKAAASDYQEAAKCWEKSNHQERATMCWQNVRRLRKQPELRAVINASEELFLGEWNALNVTLTNNGFGSATKLRIRIEGPFTVHGNGEILEVGVGERKNAEVVLRPEEAGLHVPITARITYHDAAGLHELPPITQFLIVGHPDKLNIKKKKTTE